MRWSEEQGFLRWPGFNPRKLPTSVQVMPLAILGLVVTQFCDSYKESNILVSVRPDVCDPTCFSLVLPFFKPLGHSLTHLLTHSFTPYLLSISHFRYYVRYWVWDFTTWGSKACTALGAACGKLTTRLRKMAVCLTKLRWQGDIFYHLCQKSMYNQVSLFMVVILYKVTTSTEL